MRAKRIIIGLVVALAVAFSEGSALGQGKGNGKGGGGGGGGGTPVFVVVKDRRIESLDAAGNVVETLVDMGTHTGIAVPAPNGDGTKIAFYLQDGPAGTGIYLAPTDASTGLTLLAPATALAASVTWSPAPAADGDVKIAWYEYDNPSNEYLLHLINEDGSEHITLRTAPWGLGGGRLEFSPDARFLAVQSYAPRGFGLIEFIAVGGTVAINAVSFPLSGVFPYETSAPTWISATELVFSVEGAGPAGPGLYRTNLTGGTPYLILAERSFAGGDVRPLYPNADQATGKLVFEGAVLKNGGFTSYTNRHVFTCDPDGTDAAQVTSKGKWWRWPMWL